MKQLTSSHDLRLPDWGPYTKKYIGISNIADRSRGLRFDLSVFPGYYRRKVTVPNVMWESDYHPWEAAPDLSYFSHRHELEWKDRVYCDVSFSALTDNVRLIRCEFVNRTCQPQNLVLHYLASMQFPTLGPSINPEKLRPCRVSLPHGARWIDALDYANLTYVLPPPISQMGLYRGEVRGSGFVNGSGLGGQGFGRTGGDQVTYTISLRKSIPRSMLLLRYRMENGASLSMQVTGMAKGALRLTGNGQFALARLRLGDLAAGKHVLTLTSRGGALLELDGLVVMAERNVEQLKFKLVEWHPVPTIENGPVAGSMLLKYADAVPWYGVRWMIESSEVREYHGNDVERLLRHTVHYHMEADSRSVFHGAGEGHYTDIYLRPIKLAPRETRVVFGMVTAGERCRVQRALAGFNAGVAVCERVVAAARRKVPFFPAHPAASAFGFSQARMAATTLTSVVFPAYIRRSFVRHYTPGRFWDSLYTWDAGFTGLGLLELDTERSVDCLKAYLTEPGDPHAAFILAGSPVPVQIYLFLELWNRTQSRELLEYCYPRLRQYHAFLAGRWPGSTTCPFRSKLLSPWKLCYNSGGWDDYPPQVHVFPNRLRTTITPVCTTAQAVRTAKILRMAAVALGADEDVAVYNADIAMFSAALQRHAWDEKSGYFGYVCHDSEGNPTGILRHESGQNYNMGSDGICPLVAGICTVPQTKVILRRMMDTRRLWSPLGLSTVDQSAAYFRSDGYANGSVWMPYQWFFWKALLDLGRSDLALKIAHRGLEVWRREVGQSYNCFEHFTIASGRGAGWHHFSGFSTPVLNWYGAYYRPGRLTCGFDVWVRSCRADGAHRSLRAELTLHGSGETGPHVMAVLAPGHRYRATWQGRPVRTQELMDGVLDIALPVPRGQGVLHVSGSDDARKALNTDHRQEP